MFWLRNKKYNFIVHTPRGLSGIVLDLRPREGPWPFFAHLYQSYGLDLRQILFPFNILRTNGQNFTKFYTCIYIDKIYVGIVTHHFSRICTRVMALDLHQNFVSVQYLDNKWTEFYQILYMQS